MIANLMLNFNYLGTERVPSESSVSQPLRVSFRFMSIYAKKIVKRHALGLLQTGRVNATR